MSSAFGHDGPGDHISRPAIRISRSTIECQLFESLVHHLFEKGVLTQNDALSVVQSVAEVNRGALEEAGPEAASREKDRLVLKRMYSSFQLLKDRPRNSNDFGSGKVLQLRRPGQKGRPKFPKDN